MDKEKFYSLDSSVVAKNFDVDITEGISTQEAANRLKEHGPNALPVKKPPTAIRVFFDQFLSPLMIILLLAAAGSVLISEYRDALVICIAVLLNAIVGFIQEWKAEKAAEALRSYEISVCTVRRDGRKISINTESLVPGDIVLISAGSRVPADVRLTTAVDLKVEEALLTGESEPSKKHTDVLEGKLSLGDQDNMMFRGTFALSGRGEGVVVSTGRKTAIGDIVKLASHTETSITPIQQQLRKLSIFLGIMMVVICFVVFVLGLIAGVPFHKIITISTALAVSAIPEGLLVAMTVVLSVGMQRMLKRKALVKRLIAAETLGGVSVICTDKTGTLTEGHLSVERIITPEHDININERISDDVYDALVAASLNNDASITEKDGKLHRVGDPTELALLGAAKKAGVNINEKREKFKRTNEIPFSSDLKYMATVHSGDTERLIVKGAPSVVFDMCDVENKDELKLSVDKLTGEGFRALAIAVKDATNINLKTDLGGLKFLGLFMMRDALRKDVSKTISELNSAGIRLVMITGDNARTAENIARGAGIQVGEDGVITGAELEGMSDAELADRIEKVNVFARVDPGDKVRIVKAWQDKGHSVAMKGDGVNDAPAIRRADIGIALGEGADLSKEIADMVLLDSNISTIAAAVKEGRIIFDNIRKVIINLLVDSFSEIILITGAILFKLPMPLTVVQILWINIISDGFPSMALTMEPGEEGIMTEAPRKKNEPLFNREMKVMVFFIGIVTDIGLFALFLALLHYKFELLHIQSIVFTALTIDTLLYVFSIRTIKSTIFQVNPFANKWLNGAALLGLAMQVSIIYVPFLQKLFGTISLNLHEWGFIGILAMTKITAIELFKDYTIAKKK